MTRILAAMQTWSLQSSDVLTSCLTLLHDLAQVRHSIAPPIIIFYLPTHPSLSLQGYSSGRLIARLETVSNLLQLHSRDALPKIPPHGPTARLRTVLYAFSNPPFLAICYLLIALSLNSYSTLGKLVSFEENISKFDAFLAPQKVQLLAFVRMSS
jgi:hypothetical protein